MGVFFWKMHLSGSSLTLPPSLPPSNPPPPHTNIRSLMDGSLNQNFFKQGLDALGE